MGQMITEMLNWAWGLLDFTWSNTNQKLRSIIPTRWIWKHTRMAWKYFNSAYNKMK